MTQLPPSAVALPAAAHAVAEVARRALHADDPVRAALLDGLASTSGIDARSLERLLDLWAEAWQLPGVIACLHKGLALGPGARPVGCVAVVAPGNLPVATWQAIAEPLLAGNRVRVRPGSGDPLAPGNFGRALAIVDPAVAALLEVSAFERGDDAGWSAFLQEAQALAIYGGDAAVAGVLQRAGRAGFAGSVRAHGDLQSCAVVVGDLDPDARRQVALGLAHDALLADGRGCMSLRTVCVLGGDGKAWHAEVARALDETARQFPPGRIDPQWQARGAMIAEERVFAAAGMPDCAVAQGDGWWLASRWDAEARAGRAQDELGPGGRGLELEVLDGPPQLERRLAARRGRLSTVAVAVDAAMQPSLHAILGALGVHRTCAVGRMQAPPADRSPDGHAPLSGFVRFADRS